MPNPSIYPVIAALGLFVGGVGLIFFDPAFRIGLLHMPIFCVIGIIILLTGIYGWAFEPAADPEPEPASVEPTTTVVSH
jgi:hypothetical protein